LLRKIALLDQATQLDPNYADAFARKGQFQSVWGSTFAANDTDKNRYMTDALASARRAIAIEPTLSAGYATLGLIYTNQLQMKAALAASRRAVELPGAAVPAFANYGLLLSRAGDEAGSDAMMDRATGLDPLNPQAWALKSWTLLDTRHYAESADAARHALTIAPQHLRARTLLAWDLILLDRIDEAKRELQSVPADDYRRLVAEAAIAVRSNRRNDAIASIPALQKRYANTAKYQEAQIYAQLGDADRAIQALRDSWTLRDSGLGAIKVDPFLDPVRKDPRFAPIARQVFG
jgi:tetratricopeptide (TPR) repeat protein